MYTGCSDILLKISKGCYWTSRRNENCNGTWGRKPRLVGENRRNMCSASDSKGEGKRMLLDLMAFGSCNAGAAAHFSLNHLVVTYPGRCIRNCGSVAYDLHVQCISIL